MATRREREKPQAIQVFVRTRPLNTQEKENQQTSCVEILSSEELSVEQRKYSFDQVFASDIKQVDVYKAAVYPLISEVFAGYNCTVFAYGQTGSGKTYTMVGEPSSNFEVLWQDDDLSGIVPRAMANMFEELHLTQQEHTVQISYIELYNEEVYDLLSETDDNVSRIRLFEDFKGSVIIQGVAQITVVNNEDVKRNLDKGQEKRRTAATLMNSRSHTVFTITVHTRETTAEGDVVVKTGKLNLVDLAGSENISRFGVVEERAREAGSINQSLLTLGRVIKSLVERSSHVPYRESKLTRLLQDSLGGRTKTSIIATISPAFCNVEETLSTLEYAHQARNITNRPKVNQRMSQKAVMSRYLEEIQKLRQNLQASRSSTGENQLIADTDNDKQELSLKIQEENLLDWNKINESFEKTKKELNNCLEKLVQTKNEKDQQEFLANIYEDKSRLLYNEVQSLMIQMNVSEFTDTALRTKIKNLYTTAKENLNCTKNMGNIITAKCEDMRDQLTEFIKECRVNNDRVCDILHDIQNKLDRDFEMNQAFTNSTLRHWNSYTTSQKQFVDSTQTHFESCLQNFVDLCKNHIKKIKENIKEEEHSLVENLKSQVPNKSKQAKLLRDIESNSAKISETVEALHETIDVQKDLLLLTTRNDSISKYNLESVKYGIDLTDSVLQQLIKVEGNVSELNSSLNETYSWVHNFDKLTSQFENRLSQDLSECQDTVATFTNLKYTEIVPGGDTPEKMQCYFRNLNPPSPKERILERFQQNLDATETINESNDDIETELAKS